MFVTAISRKEVGLFHLLTSHPSCPSAHFDMQTNRSNAALAARTAATASCRSTSPLDGPLNSVGVAASQLNSLSLKGAASATASPVKRSSNAGAAAGHVRSKSSALIPGLGGSRHSNSPAKQQQSVQAKHRPSKSVSDVSKSARTSPVKPIKSGHVAKTPSRTAGSLGRSTGPAAVKDTVAAGGLGRMDIAGKDWDSKSSSNGSAGNSPQKKKLAASTKVRQ